MQNVPYRAGPGSHSALLKGSIGRRDPVHVSNDRPQGGVHEVYLQLDARHLGRPEKVVDDELRQADDRAAGGAELSANWDFKYSCFRTLTSNIQILFMSFF